MHTHRLRPLLPILMFLLLGLAACSDDGNDPPAQDPANNTANNDAPDAGNNDQDSGQEPDADEPPPEEGYCQKEGLEAIDFAQGDTGTRYGDLVSDFTAQTLDGPLTLSEHWSGCESYVFLNYIPDLRANPAPGWPGDSLWATDIAPLLTEAPRNVHYVFTSFEELTLSRSNRMNALKARFEEAIEANFTEEADKEHWRTHVHFVIDRVTEIEGGPGAFMSDYFDFMFSDDGVVDLGDRGQAQAPLPFAFAIDRGQRWDPGGSLSPVVGQADEFAMAAYLGHFFNHRADLNARAEQDTTSTIIPMLDEDVTDRIITRQVQLPDNMDEFDTLEFDISVTCPYRNPFACSEWDRIARIDLCLDEECTDRREVARWITPYWRRGNRRWFIDASPFLGLMRDGGQHTFRIEMGPEWERKTERRATMSIRLSNNGAPKAVGAVRAFTGGNFNEDYNDNKPPFSFSVPDDASLVELVVILSGHGQESGSNCAEWCDHRHDFIIRGIPVGLLRPEEGVTGALRGCADQAGAGVPPGQWGNWAPGRAYWCPGMPVPTHRFDITDRITKGMDANNVMQYFGTFAGNDPEGGNIAMSAYIVWYND